MELATSEETLGKVDASGHLAAEAVGEVDASTHRYPACVVWTPIPPITAFAPFVGHVGVCSAEGQTFDWTGMINVDDMAFGWPTRYIPWAPEDPAEWDRCLERTVRTFESGGPAYNFVTWNCHSFVVHVLNQVDGTRKWNVASLCVALFFRGRFMGPLGALWSLAPTFLVYSTALVYGGLGGACTVFMYANLPFAIWFLIATMVGVDGMHGRWREEPSSGEIERIQEIP